MRKANGEQLTDLYEVRQANLDIFWLRDKSLEGSEDLQPLDVIAAEIAENLEAASEQFAEIHEDLRVSTTE